MHWNITDVAKVLRENGVVVMPTDTLYGILGSALEKEVVERIYKIRGRDTDKPCIILIGDISELEDFFIDLSPMQKIALGECWPGPVSVVLPCESEAMSYLHRGTKTLAFRLPKNTELQSLLKATGPLIAPSANPQGMPPAKDISEARQYFGELVDMYVDGGTVLGSPSKVIRLYNDGTVSIIRE